MLVLLLILSNTEATVSNVDTSTAIQDLSENIREGNK